MNWVELCLFGSLTCFLATGAYSQGACWERCSIYPTGYDKPSDACYDGCQISESAEDIVGTIDGSSSTWYYCLNNMETYDQLSNFEIRVIGSYESTSGHSGFQQHNSGPITVHLQSCFNDNYNYNYSMDASDVFIKPTILFLTSYEPVNWIITTSDSIVENNINLLAIHVSSYYYKNSTVSIINDKLSTEIINKSDSYGYGYGNDCGGGSTQTILESMNQLFGNDLYSFLGMYEFDTIYQCVGYQNNTVISYNITATDSTGENDDDTDIVDATSDTDIVDATSDTAKSIFIAVKIIAIIILLSISASL